VVRTKCLLFLISSLLTVENDPKVLGDGGMESGSLNHCEEGLPQASHIGSYVSEK
jgi:hypothetical protein